MVINLDSKPRFSLKITRVFVATGRKRILANIGSKCMSLVTVFEARA